MVSSIDKFWVRDIGVLLQKSRWDWRNGLGGMERR